ncbi:hemerythrin domain-containing protein [Dactylosporangium sp. NPDC051541]|uniref:hemerythrin domain-containing protein n=1 Tax=Dactylosporangium sp. NPDC051541 TaxID=3363977 RepID=UPI0037A8B93D
MADAPPTLAQIHAALRDHLTAARRDPAAHCLTFCGALTAHHCNEDGAFPRLERELPESAPLLRQLREEHEAIARQVDRLRDDPDPAVALERLAGELEEHFATEERDLVPLLSRLR